MSDGRYRVRRFGPLARLAVEKAGDPIDRFRGRKLLKLWLTLKRVVRLRDREGLVTHMWETAGSLLGVGHAALLIGSCIYEEDRQVHLRKDS